MPIKTSDFKTRSSIVQCAIPSNPDYWVMGLDIGYSAVKGMSPNKYYCFPSYAKKIPKNRVTLKEEQATDIRYREDESHSIWTVGSLAYDEVVAANVMDSEAELYGRNRYFSPMFQVISRVGMAIGLMANPYGSAKGRKIAIQTGLPSGYMDDTPYMKESLAGHHVFELKIGKAPWQKFDFVVEPDDVYVIPQPLGSLLSASIGADGKNLPISKQYFSSNLVIFDPGFGTMDDYTVMSGNVVNHETFPELGMREVFARTCKDIKEKFGVSIQIPELQNKLMDGYIKSIDRRAMKSQKHSFAEILENNSKTVCKEAVEKLKNVHDYFANVDYIIATGGTYDAWKDEFDAVFRDMDGLEIIPGNINDPNLSNIYSNVRGYYHYLNNILKPIQKSK